MSSLLADIFMGFEEIDGDDDIREEFPCPFCSEYFDIVGLCCHIDEEHPLEARNGVRFLLCMSAKSDYNEQMSKCFYINMRCIMDACAEKHASIKY